MLGLVADDLLANGEADADQETEKERYEDVEDEVFEEKEAGHREEGQEMRQHQVAESYQCRSLEAFGVREDQFGKSVEAEHDQQAESYHD